MQKAWTLTPLPDTFDPSTVPPEIHPVTARLLAVRGQTDPQSWPDFFQPDFHTGVHDPWLFSNMPRAVERIFQAIDQGEHITVHGDYDADGVTGSAVLLTTLKEIVAKKQSSSILPQIDFYIPHRDKEGYGLNIHTVDLLKERGTNLIITVDCGIACVPEIAKAKTLGMDTIVVDHHQFGEELPDGILIHPRLPGEAYPFPHLAAVGVAWKCACALVAGARKRGIDMVEGFEKWLLDFVSIATVTDMVPLVGENRVLETYGLKVMNKTRRPGLQRLIQIAGSELGKMTSQDIGFGLGPRINAAGRMDHASIALQLMLAETEEEASIFAAQLEDCNKRRQKLTAKMMDEAEKMPASAAPIRVLYAPHWSPALVGLVAGKYMEREGKPVVAIGKHGETWIGSGRSFAKYDITEAMKRVGEGILTRCGGHVQACGFALTDDDLVPELVRRLEADASERLKPEDCIPVLPIDAELKLDDIRWDLIDLVSQLEPYGEGNRRPIFMSTNLTVLSSDKMGSTQKHVRCLLKNGQGEVMKFVGFNFADRFELFSVGNRIDVAYDLGINEWNGRREIQCKLVDVRRA